MSKETSTLPIKLSQLALNLNKSVVSVTGSKNLLGFEKAYAIAIAAGELKSALTSEFMKPIMDLQGNRLGFKTDKDNASGYPEAIVKNCLIEAVLTGVQPFGNQFNIIAGNCYITKEGFGYLLKNTEGLSYEIIPQLPRIKDQSGAVVMKIEWTYNGIKNTREIDFAIKVNNYMGTDAVIGKATRKARAWLFNTINGTEIADGDISDLDRKQRVTVYEVSKENKEHERIRLMIDQSNTIEELDTIYESLPEELDEIYFQRKEQISKAYKSKDK